jgi:hypothetical protein
MKLKFTAILVMFGSTIFAQNTIAPTTLTATLPLGTNITVNKVVTIGVTSPVTTYSTVSLGVSPVPAGVTIIASPASFTGSFDTSVTRTFNFAVTFTGSIGGNYPFGINALVDGATVATEADNFTITVVAPTVIKSFSTPSGPLNPGDQSTITVTIINPNAGPLTGLAFNDVLPTGLALSTPSGLANSCGGVAFAGVGILSLTGGSVGASTSCAVTVNVTNQAFIGPVTNPAISVSANGSPNGISAPADLAVDPLLFLWFFFST